MAHAYLVNGAMRRLSTVLQCCNTVSMQSRDARSRSLCKTVYHGVIVILIIMMMMMMRILEHAFVCMILKFE